MFEKIFERKLVIKLVKHFYSEERDNRDQDIEGIQLKQIIQKEILLVGFKIIIGLLIVVMIIFSLFKVSLALDAILAKYTNDSLLLLGVYSFISFLFFLFLVILLASPSKNKKTNFPLGNENERFLEDKIMLMSSLFLEGFIEGFGKSKLAIEKDGYENKKSI